jgi:hypothetical protein
VSDASIPVQLRGERRGADVSGPALLWATDDGLAIAGDRLRRPITVRFTELDGATTDEGDAAGRPPSLTLFLAGGDVLVVEGDARVAEFGRLLVRRATAFPELTRALRAVGARRGLPGEEHDRFFAPLLGARAEAERADGWAAQLDAFAAPALRDAWAATLAGFAGQRHPASAPDRRALEAALAESLEATGACLGRVEAAADAVRAADDTVRLARWRQWVAEIARLFGEADRCWLAALRELAESPPTAAPAPRPGLWRRLRGR